MSNSDLAWLHFLRALSRGFLWLLAGAALGGVGKAWPTTLPIGIEWLNSLPKALSWAMGSMVTGSIFLGIPAVVVGLLCQPLMRLLFKYCRARGSSPALPLALLGTFVVFELPVVFLATSQDNLFSGSSSFVLSLPWLLGSLGATWSLREQLANSPAVRVSVGAKRPG